MRCPKNYVHSQKKKYFAVIAVVFFALVTAIIFALLAQQTTVQNVDQLRTDIKSGNFERDYAEKPQSLIDRVVSGITGRSNRRTQNTDETTSTDQVSPQQPIQGGSRGGQNITSGTVIPPQDQEELVKKVKEEAMPLPKVAVREYVLNTQLPQSPESVRIYRYKTAYSETDIQNMAQVLGFSSLNSNDVVVEKNGDGLTQIFDLKHKLFLAVNNKTGTMMFSAQNGIVSSGTGDAKQQALALARSLGYTQSCLKATATYSKKSVPRTTHIDIHCEWDSVGAPIINYFGILNLPVAEALNSVTLGSLPGASDGDITDDNTGTMSMRPNDFNTITVQQDTLTGNIMAFSSNIMPLLAEIEIPASQIISPEGGFDRLKK
ncbi:MAG: hypothetical protein UZ22_OP11002001041 [Microgenomates bacterium OLB23]|nr:MAG: hypothetical protein UZ22_OP11002001041 [Microgenomates bacterium OLB23]